MSKCQLTFVSVPPDEPRIFDAQGKEISHIAGPFREGYEMFLSCQVTSGISIRLCAYINVEQLYIKQFIHYRSSAAQSDVVARRRPDEPSC